MADMELKTYRVTKKSWVNNGIHDAGDIVTVRVDPETWHPGPNLVEITEPPAGHTKEQKEAGDKAAEARKESIKKREEAEKKAEAEAHKHEPEKVSQGAPFNRSPPLNPFTPPQTVRPSDT